MIDFLIIKDDSLNVLIQKIDDSIEYIKREFGFELKSYEAMLRIALNAIHCNTFIVQ